MNLAEAVEFLRPAVDPWARDWADLGAGSGTFTSALAKLVPDGSTILAIDNDPEALRKLRELQAQETAARIVPVDGDVERLGEIPGLEDRQWDAAILANVLHYFAEPIDVLRSVASRIRVGGRVVLVEYDRTSSNRWVPYPIPLSGAAALASEAGFVWGGVVAQRPSRYHGALYCAVLSTVSSG